ncbi:response regulator transcription factor family protein [Brevundimonas pondensis]|uniref:Response regulator transcription factor n=1 Tax=Brevundimonas pondensis TaxID=2774189 RepID=A0ABX7SP01_9CAUL|nr:response regulator transcription factor [Brevundimonas pondensis]QTC88615.1 response regulator transcription factor [Brevundimonas pondensis]
MNLYRDLHMADMPENRLSSGDPGNLLLINLGDDEPHALGSYLERAGFIVSATTSLDHMRDREVSLAGHFDAVVLAARLPNCAALGAVRDLSRPDSPPLLVVALEGEVVERVLVLEMGAGDLVGRETAPREVLARLHRLIRRKPETPLPSPVLPTFDETWTMKLAQRALITPKGQHISLSGRDQALLEVFTRHVDGFILEDDFPRGHIRTAISRLKRKVMLNSGVELPIQNVWGQGYRLDAVLVTQ